MNSKPTHTLGVVGVALLAALSPTAASAHPGADADTTTQANRALVVRSEARNIFEPAARRLRRFVRDQ